MEHYHLGRSTHHQGKYLDHGKDMISQNIQIIIVVDPTMQSNEWTKRNIRNGWPNHHRASPVPHSRKKAVSIKSLLGLPPLMNSPCRGEKRQTVLNLSTSPCDPYTSSNFSECFDEKYILSKWETPSDILWRDKNSAV